jgi:galactonate dehydratase
MHQGLRFPPGSIGLTAISSIEYTLWDISAQALGLPVHKMLGGNVRDKIRVYQSVQGNTPEKTAEHAQQLIGKYGYTGLKMSPYPPEPDEQLWNGVLRDGPRFIEAVRHAVGFDIDIGLDAHAKFEFNKLMQAQAADIIQPDVCICGGLMETRKIAAIAEGHDVMVAPHNPMGPIATAINVHFAVATYNFSILEFVPHDEGRRSEFVREPWVPIDGCLDIPDKPGWGIEVNESALSKYPYQAYLRGNPRRSDGSPAFI